MGSENHPALLVVWEWVGLLSKQHYSEQRDCLVGLCEVINTDDCNSSARSSRLRNQECLLWGGDERADGELFMRQLSIGSCD